MITCTRYHDISCGHRVVGHEGKCVGLHGHNYRIHFEAASSRWAAMEEGSDGLDQLGRVIDFGVLKSHLCQWLEDNWDHKMLLWDQDPIAWIFDEKCAEGSPYAQAKASLVKVPFNPTAEQMAHYLLRQVGPTQLAGTGVRLFSVIVEETRKCSATAVID